MGNYGARHLKVNGMFAFIQKISSKALMVSPSFFLFVIQSTPSVSTLGVFYLHRVLVVN